MAQGEHCLPERVRDNLEKLAGFLRVLAEPNRLRVMCLLMQQETCVCDLMPWMGISQPLLSHHLGVLAEAGLVQTRRQAQRVYYSVVPEALAQLKQLLLAHLDPATLPAAAAPRQSTAQYPKPEPSKESLE